MSSSTVTPLACSRCWEDSERAKGGKLPGTWNVYQFFLDCDNGCSCPGGVPNTTPIRSLTCIPHIVVRVCVAAFVKTYHLATLAL